jgi:hypothetical protein
MMRATTTPLRSSATHRRADDERDERDAEHDEQMAHETPRDDRWGDRIRRAGEPSRVKNSEPTSICVDGGRTFETEEGRTS